MRAARAGGRLVAVAGARCGRGPAGVDSQALDTLNRLAAFAYISEASSNLLLLEPKSDHDASLFSAFAISSRALPSCDIAALDVGARGRLRPRTLMQAVARF